MAGCSERLSFLPQDTSVALLKFVFYVTTNRLVLLNSYVYRTKTSAT